MMGDGQTDRDTETHIQTYTHVDILFGLVYVNLFKTTKIFNRKKVGYILLTRRGCMFKEHVLGCWQDVARNRR